MRLAVWAHLDDDPADQLNALLIERARLDDPAVVLGIKAMNWKLGEESSHTRDVIARPRKPLAAPLGEKTAKGERSRRPGQAGAIVNTTATVASTSWAPGWTLVGVVVGAGA